MSFKLDQISTSGRLKPTTYSLKFEINFQQFDKYKYSGQRENTP